MVRAGALLLVGTSAVLVGSAPATRLAITLYPQGFGGPSRHYTLTCDSPGGTVPQPARACRVLARLKDPFAPTPPGTMCTDLALGPQKATITGRLRGERVSAQLSVAGGCEINRWRRVTSVVPGFSGSP